MQPAFLAPYLAAGVSNLRGRWGSERAGARTGPDRPAQVHEGVAVGSASAVGGSRKTEKEKDGSGQGKGWAPPHGHRGHGGYHLRRGRQARRMKIHRAIWCLPLMMRLRTRVSTKKLSESELSPSPRLGQRITPVAWLQCLERLRKRRGGACPARAGGPGPQPGRELEDEERTSVALQRRSLGGSRPRGRDCHGEGEGGAAAAPPG